MQDEGRPVDAVGKIGGQKFGAGRTWTWCLFGWWHIYHRVGNKCKGIDVENAVLCGKCGLD